MIMEAESGESALANERKLRLTQRYHLIGNDCIVESSQIKPSIAKIVDVSNSGALIHARKCLGSEGDCIDVYLRMNLGEENTIFPVRAVIKKIRAEDDSGRLMHGVEFIDINSETNLLLKNYIYKAMTE